VPEESKPEDYPFNPDTVAAWKMIHDHTLLQKYLLQRNMKHFNQAHGTPFTIPPLDNLDWEASSEEAKQLLKGEIPPNLHASENPFVREVLEHIASRKLLPEFDIFITPDEVARGYRRWKETTSTSPSGCHLGLRRIPAIPTGDEETEKIRTQILNIQTQIINIPLQQGFSPQRWQTVINAMLEKIQGKPLLHKLRVIHIMEADYNLALKVIFGKRLMKNCESYGTLGDYQDGFRKGRSTTRTLLHNKLLTDYNKRLRIDNYIGMTDISGCFDRILPSIIALLNRKNGCPESAVKMHAQTLRNARYYLKTQLGVSEEYYSNDILPVYGNGQGAGDSPSQWSQESAMLFKIYRDLVPGAKMSLREGQTIAEIPLTAFADDTNLTGNNDEEDKTTEDLIKETKYAFYVWDRLLHATGHFMELGKCACYLSVWKFQDDGYAYTMSPDEHGQQLYVTDISGDTQIIPQLPTNKAQRLLGVMKCPIGDQQEEIKRLRIKSDSYAQKINSNYLTRAEARLAYEAFYLPAIRYSLNTTSINQINLENVQAKATTAFLSAQGYNRHMPREVVYASSLHQGIGIRHLYDLQGSDGVRLFLQEINQEGSTTQHMIIAALDTIQLEAGIGKPIMEDCRPLDYIEWGWVPHLRDFLHHIQGSIIVGERKPKIYRENDSYLMDSKYLDGLTRRERIYIHRCRIQLQVETISDVASAMGQTIHPAWKSPSKKKPSRSILKWPRQNQPSRIAWLSWEKFLASFTTSSGKLHKPLGKWIEPNKTRIHEAYQSDDGEILWVASQNHGKGYVGHSQKATHRKAITFHRVAATEADDIPPLAAPVDILTYTENEIRTTRRAGNKQANKKQETTTWSKKSSQRLRHIIGDIDITRSESGIRELIAERSIFEAASDGGFDPDTGISSFGWVMAINKNIIARGRGEAQAHPYMAESFRAEGYGLTSVLLFIRNLINKFNIRPKEHTWKIHLDSKSLLQRLSSYHTKMQVPRWNLRPDEDVVRIAHKLMSTLPIKLCHVRSHQDEKNSSAKINFEAQMNILADHEATCQKNKMTGPADDVRNIAIAQLRIGGVAITRDSQQWILQAAGKIPIQQYYWERHGWNDDTFNNICWETQRAILRTYSQDDQTRIIKFVHGWLPTRHRQAKEGTAVSPGCSLCTAVLEDNLHLFVCRHKEMERHQAKLATHISKWLQEHGDSEITNLFDLGLQESAHPNRSWKPDMRHVSVKWRKAVEAQNEIGWHHIFYGRIAKDLKTEMDQHYQEEGAHDRRTNGEQWARKLIRTIWDTMLALWGERNKILNKRDDDIARAHQKEATEQRVRQCYAYKDNL
jgi:hypothetical protein